MKMEPLNENELEWLDDVLTKYNTDQAILDVAELDGLITAVLSSPRPIEPEQWLVAIWGGPAYVPRWTSEKEMTRFMDLVFQHMADTAARLEDYPEQFEPLFGLREVDGHELTIVEEWCFGYMRGVSLSDWSDLPDTLKPALEAIALHGTEENFALLDKMSPEAFDKSVDAIRSAALELHAWWMAHPHATPLQMPIKAEVKVGRNDPCPCGSGKKFKQCCLH
ncbi:YecA family protein [Salmonella enterica subsp. enterica serovar Agona]|nr:YecA family protein [Salmonella enterica subsp. enterica serovar Agona]ECG5386034.1 YecA family protein [Salmonella enterica subsp. enterica serovar Agona]